MIQPNIYPITENDLKAVAKIHVAAFPRSALTNLGIEAIFRYYHWLLCGPHDCTAVAIYEESRMIGYLFGGTFRGAMTGFLNKNQKFLIFRILTHPWLITNAIVFQRLTLARRILTRNTKVRNLPQQISSSKSFSILAIAVDPAAQKKGMGRKLMQYAEQSARENGFQQMHLSVAVNNHEAIRFYENLDWQREPSSKWDGKMTKKLFKSV